MANLDKWVDISNNILDMYCDYFGDQNIDKPISIQSLAKITEDKFSVKITFEDGSADSLISQGILGALVRYDRASINDEEKIRIIIANLALNELSYCYRRYIWAKEICHIWLDDEYSYVNKPASLIDDLLLSNFGADLEPDQMQSRESERLTKFMAAQVLFPQRQRDYCKQQMQSGDKTALDIATQYRIPAVLIDLVLSDKYSEFVKKNIT